MKEWKSFEEQEQWIKYVTGDNCDQRIYIHSNQESLCKLVKVLNEQFFVNGVFQKTKRNGLEWKEAFIKYVCRVSFPIQNLTKRPVKRNNVRRNGKEIAMNKIRNSTRFQSANQKNERSKRNNSRKTHRSLEYKSGACHCHD